MIEGWIVTDGGPTGSEGLVSMLSIQGVSLVKPTLIQGIANLTGYEPRAPRLKPFLDSQNSMPSHMSFWLAL